MCAAICAITNGHLKFGNASTVMNRSVSNLINVAHKINYFHSFHRKHVRSKSIKRIRSQCFSSVHWNWSVFIFTIRYICIHLRWIHWRTHCRRVMSFRKSMKIKMYHRNDVQTKIKFIIQMPAYLARTAWVRGVGMRQKQTHHTLCLSFCVLSTAMVHILWLNHFGALTLFVICCETIEHKTTLDKSIIINSSYRLHIPTVLCEYLWQINTNEMHFQHMRIYAENICICTWYASMSPWQRMS